MNAWLRIDFECAAEQLAELSACLEALGAKAVSCVAAENQPDLFVEDVNQEVCWPQSVVQAFFTVDCDAPGIIQSIHSFLPDYKGQASYQIVPDKDWVLETQNLFQPRQFGRLWVYPSWQDIPAIHQPAVKLDPGWGFGTGQHPTTAMCMQWIAEQDWQNHSLLDYGCGSGLLALGALVLGAKNVWATDNDPQALQATSQNYVLNDCDQHQSHIVLPQHLPQQSFDRVCANILQGPLVALKDELSTLTKKAGQLCLSGFYEEDVDAMLAAYAHMHCCQVDVSEGWACIVLENRGQ